MPKVAEGSDSYLGLVGELFDLAISRMPLSALPKIKVEREKLLKGQPTPWALRVAYGATHSQATPIAFFAFNPSLKEGGDGKWNQVEADKYAALVERLAKEASGKEETDEKDGDPATGSGDATGGDGVSAPEEDPDVDGDAG